MPKSIKADGYLKTLPVLVAARQAQGLTQVELAERLGKPQSYVSKIERGERRLDVVEFCALAEALKIAPSSLLQRVLAALNE